MPLSPGAPEFLFQLSPAELDECGATVRTGVRHRASSEVGHQLFEFLTGECIIRLHCMAADGLGHDVLAEPQGIDTSTRGPQFVDQPEHELSRVAGPDKRRHRLQQEGPITEFPQLDPESSEHGQMLQGEVGVLHSHLNRLGHQQTL